MANSTHWAFGVGWQLGMCNQPVQTPTNSHTSPDLLGGDTGGGAVLLGATIIRFGIPSLIAPIEHIVLQCPAQQPVVECAPFSSVLFEKP